MTPTPTTPTEPVSLVGEPPKAEAPKEAPKDEPAAHVPLTADTLKLPDGFEVQPELQTEFLALANELKFSPEVANKLVALQAKANAMASEKGAEAFASMQKQWQDQVRADPVIGGANLEPTLAGINKLINAYGDQEVREVFHVTGAGNSLPMLRMLAKISKELNEATPISGQPAGSVSAGGLADKLYPTQGTQA